ncbi:hypothetical protein HYH02_004451 [Chlamydomonas schloesseri]|uniref:Uncharacterized protein n=1 Tax=Chlamydomonas schloesseri TaxID=2026947 RepID=A0A835WNB1_9CHLO|nr:hypothetical protein HYH02_004451 [Chlamydomonas schloesseri]|eukprot:KAG2450611.1 hypothetical protein HYH02_004451 [Chlamydomonas schloesseri]
MADVGVSEDERKKRGVFYETCTSTFKDDFPTLVKCLKANDPISNPHTRQEAGFLLWHHALEGEDVGGLVSGGVIPACLTCLDAWDVSITDKGCCAGILLALVADNEELAETALKARATSSSNTCLEILHSVVMLRDATNARAYAAKALHALARHATAPFLRSLTASADAAPASSGSGGAGGGGGGGPLSVVLPMYLSVWGGADQKDAVVIAALAGVVIQLTNEKPDLAVPVVEAGGVEALLGVLQRQKSEAVGTAVAALLARLVPNVEGAPQRLVEAGGIALLADVIGPPPRSIVTWEQHTLADLAAAEAAASALAASPSSTSLGRGPGEAGGTGMPTAGTPKGGAGGKSSNSGQAEPASPSGAAAPTTSGLKTRFSRDVTKDVAGLNLGAAGAAAAADTAQGTPAQVTGYGTPVPPVRVQLPLVIPGLAHSSGTGGGGSRAASPGLSPQPSSYSLFAAEASSMSVATTATGLAGGGRGGAAAGPPALPHPTDFSTNRSAIRWILLPGLDLASYAAACLAAVLHNPEWLAQVDRRLVTHRILAQVKAVAAPKPAPEGKKKSKKGLTLSPEQSAALTRLLGVVKLLATTNTNRYRIAHLEALPALLVLYDEGPDYLLRNHCQNILVNVAVLAENGRKLLDAKMPEEFLVTNPMRLTADERVGLRCEFPLDGALEESIAADSAATKF